MSGLIEVSPGELEGWLGKDEAVLVDVREPFERASERIDSSHHMPLASLEPKTVRDAHAGKRVVFHCKSGKRSTKAAQQWLDAGETEAYHLAGGIDAWKASGRSTVRGAPPIDIMRQVQISAGSLVLIGVALSLVSPWFIGISAFVGAGLVFAGASGWCGMAMMLGAMPWNKA